MTFPVMTLKELQVMSEAEREATLVDRRTPLYIDDDDGRRVVLLPVEWLQRVAPDWHDELLKDFNDDGTGREAI